ncbi:MAG TPA: endolytic transglycosylase MltG [Desulfuromonadales bacterium]
MTRRSTVLRIILPIFLLLTIAVGFKFASFVFQPVTPAASALVNVTPGLPLAEVAGRLQDAGVVRSASGFKLLAWLRGDVNRIKAGPYDFSGPAKPGSVLDRLVAGDVRRQRLTIPEGFSLREIAARIEAEGLGRAETILRLARDPKFIAGLGIASPTLEGYLFPETYLFASGTPEDRIIKAMVRQFKSRLAPDLVEGAARLGLDPHQLVTLASIIQKEAGTRTEMPVIAAVFHNRLRRKMPLQADPTVIYGIADFNGNITRKDLRTPTPYNTYRMAGLPPGPIASPGEDALRAAAFPAKADYLYFVARGDGTHAFSKNLLEHNRAVRHYQLKR